MEFVVNPVTLETEETVYYECDWNSTGGNGANISLPDCICKYHIKFKNENFIIFMTAIRN